MVTRRALLGAGALLLAGCGPPDEREVVAADELTKQWRASQAAAAAYEGVPEVQQFRASAEARTRRLAAAVKRAGGSVPPGTARAPAGVEGVLAAERAALQTYVQGVGQLAAREHRELLAGVITGSAAAESALLQVLNRAPAPSAFPGQPPSR